MKVSVDEPRHESSAAQIDALGSVVLSCQLRSAHGENPAIFDDDGRLDRKRFIDGQHLSVEQQQVRASRRKSGSDRNERSEREAKARESGQEVKSLSPAPAKIRRNSPIAQHPKDSL